MPQSRRKWLQVKLAGKSRSDIGAARENIFIARNCLLIRVRRPGNQSRQFCEFSEDASEGDPPGGLVVEPSLRKCPRRSGQCLARPLRKVAGSTKPCDRILRPVPKESFISEPSSGLSPNVDRESTLRIVGTPKELVDRSKAQRRYKENLPFSEFFSPFSFRRRFPLAFPFAIREIN